MTNAFSYARLRAVGLSELPRDINGVPDGPEYESFIRVGDMKAQHSIRAGQSGVYSGRQHHLAGRKEVDGFMRLEGNPFILSIREGYPIFAENVLQDAVAGRVSNRDQVRTIDFVLTLLPRNFGGPLRYRAISQKPEYLKRTPKEMRRAQRERGDMERVGWSWDYLGPPKPESAQTVRNHELLRIWATSPDNASIDSVEIQAQMLGASLYQTSSKKPLGSLLAMLGKRLAIPEDMQLYVFACAYYFGFVQLSHAAALGIAAPVNLLPPARRFGGGL